MSLSVSSAVELLFCDTLTAYIYSPNAESEVIQELLNLYPKIDLTRSVHQQLQLEYALQLYWLNLLVDGSSGQLVVSEELDNAPLYKRLEIRSDFAEFQLHSNFLLPSHPDTHESNLESTDSFPLPEHSKDVIAFLTIGSSYYLNSAIKIQLTLDSLEIAATCRAYQLKHNRYPSSLDDLAPTYLEKLPTLPYSTENFSYSPPTAEDSHPTISGTVHLEKPDDISVTWPEQAKP